MNRAISKLCVLIGAVSILSGCGSPGSLSEKDRQPPVSGWKIVFHESGSIPVIADGVLYVGSADGAVYALDPKTGETKWRFQTGENLSPATSGPNVITVPRGTGIDDQLAAGISGAERQRGEGIRRVDMTPAVENGTVFIGSGDRSFYAIDAATGKKKWSYVAGPGMASRNYTSVTRPAAVLKNGTVYFESGDGLHALDALTGKRKWLFETGPRVRVPTGLVMGDGVIFLVGEASVVAVDLESGKAKWVTTVSCLDTTASMTAQELAFFAARERSMLLSRRDCAVLVAGNTIYFSTTKSLVALELKTGRRLWNFIADDIAGGVFVGNPGLWADNQHLYVVTHRGSIMRSNDTLHALDLNTGQEKWLQSLSGHVRVAMIDDGVVYAGGERLHAIDAATGKELWSFKGTGRLSAQLISGGRVFLTSPTMTYFGTNRVDQGYLYAIDAKTGRHEP